MFSGGYKRGTLAWNGLSKYKVLSKVFMRLRFFSEASIYKNDWILFTNMGYIRPDIVTAEAATRGAL